VRHIAIVEPSEGEITMKEFRMNIKFEMLIAKSKTAE
jgi:hypothetical protein